MELQEAVKRIYLRTDPKVKQVIKKMTEQLVYADRLRYNFHGKMRMTNNSNRFLILSSETPYNTEGFSGTVEQNIVNIETDVIAIEMLNLSVDSVVKGPIFTLPVAQIELHHRFASMSKNHWIQDMNFIEKDIY
jgi:hypothetical protein